MTAGHEAAVGGSYDPHRAHRSYDQEIARLEAQVAVSWPEELRALRRAGVADGATIVEAGCGPGFVTRRLRDAFPRATIHGVDTDPALLAVAAGMVGEAPNVFWHHASAYATGLSAASADVVLARFLFQHLAEPVRAVREAVRVLRPGGLLVVLDVDGALWGVVTPTFPEVAAIHARAGRAQAARGGDRLVGRRLHRILQEGGCEDVVLDAVVYHSDARGLAAFEPQLDPARLAPLVADGVVTPEELALARRVHERFLAAPDPFVLMLTFMATGRRAP